MPSDQKVDYIELPTADFDAVQSFYEKAFDWSFTDFGPEYRAFTDGKVDGGFYRSKLHSSTQNGATLVILYAEDLEKSKKDIAWGSQIRSYVLHLFFLFFKLKTGRICCSVCTCDGSNAEALRLRLSIICRGRAGA